MSHLGIDIGSTGTKAIAFDPEGAQLATAYREYAEVYPGPNLIELPSEDVWAAVCDVIREVAAATSADPIETLAISAIGECSAKSRYSGTCSQHWLS